MRGIQFIGDKLALLGVELLLVTRHRLVELADPHPRQVGVVDEHQVLPAHLFHDEVGGDVVRLAVRLSARGLGVELGHCIGGRLDLLRGDSKPLRQVAPSVRDEFIEELAHESRGEGALVTPRLDLQQQALAQVARADSRRFESLDQRDRRFRLR